MTPGKPVAITGMGCLCAAGLTLDDSMNAVFDGRRHAGTPLQFTGNHSTIYPVFEILDGFFPAHEFKIPDVLRTCQLALTAALEAIRDAGWDRKALKKKRVGVCIGTTVGSAMNNEDFYRENRMGCDPDMAPIERFLISNPSSSIAREFGASGPCQTVVNACSSGTDAIGVAMSWIRSGICDVVITGGADELCRVTYNGFISLMIADEHPCKPFDAHRKGLNLGEGAAILILESEDTAIERNKAPRAFALGYGAACDAYHITTPRPDGNGLKLALLEAMGNAKINPQDVAFINVHGTGTPDNDRIESHIIHQTFGQAPFVSTKGCTGHTLGAAGAIEAAFTVCCLEQQRIPGCAGFETPDSELPVSPSKDITPVHGKAAVSQSLAFGGNNGVLVLGIAG